MDAHPKIREVGTEQRLVPTSLRSAMACLSLVCLITGANHTSPAQQTSAPPLTPAPQTALPGSSPAQTAPAPTSTQVSPTTSSQAVPGQPALATPAPAAADAASYVIGAEDVLQITVWNEPKMSGSLPVRPDGMISIPLIGDLPAAGKTPTRLGTDIAERSKKFIQDPSVTVVVTAVNSQKIFLVGEVSKVGPIALSPGMSVLQAIATAGGPSPYASVKHIYILRGTGAQQQKIPFNYKQALKGENRQPIELRPGDTIVIP